MNPSSETVLHTRVGLWLGGSLLLHALAVPLLDLTYDNAGAPPASLHVTLLGALPTSGGSVGAAAEPVNAQSPAHLEPAALASTPTATVSDAAKPSKPRSTTQIEPTALTSASTAAVSDSTEPSKPRSTPQLEPAATASASTTAKAHDRAAKTASHPTPAPVHRAAADAVQGTVQTMSPVKVAALEAAVRAAAGSVAKSPVSGAIQAPRTASDHNPGAALDTRLDSPGHQVFVRLLHAAIDQNKRYPRLARRQRRQGVATVLFRLHPHGGVDRLELHDSSGFAALDAAALRAVAAVAPFAPAAKFLTREAHFRIGVAFHLY